MPFARADGDRFDERGLPHGEEIRIVAQRSDRRPRDRRHPAEDRQVHELGPDLDLDLVAERRADPGVAAGVEQPLEPRRPRAVELAEDEPVERGVPDDAGFGDDRLNVRGPAGEMRAIDGARQHLHAVDAVLERDDDGVGADERRQQRNRRFRVVQLHGEEHHVDRADRRRHRRLRDTAGGEGCRSGSRCGARRFASASRCAPRARNVTSTPAAASRPPK